MKKTILFAALLSVAVFANAQSIILLNNATGAQVAQGDTVTAYGTPGDMPAIQFRVANTTDHAIDHLYAKSANTDRSGIITVASLCMGACLPGSLSPEFSVAAGDTATDILVAEYLIPDDAPLGTENIFSLTIGDNAPDYNNMNTIYIKMIVHSSAITDAEADPALLQAHPNPAHHQVCISYQLPRMVNGRLVMYNAMGAKVKEMPVSAAEGRVAVNVENLPQGVYTYGFVGNGYRTPMKKLVLR